MSVLEGYLTEAQLAEQISRDIRTLRTWRAQRKGPAWTPIGKSIFYAEEAIRSWLKSLERQPVRSRRAA